MMNHLGTLRLETERLILRKETSEDAFSMYQNWASDPEVPRYMSWEPLKSVSEAHVVLYEKVLSRYHLPEFYEWGIIWKPTGELIGAIGTSRNDPSSDTTYIGYCISRPLWGKGIVPEALKAVLEFLFGQVGFQRVCAKHHMDNSKSGRVMEKCGMVFFQDVVEPFKGQTAIFRHYHIRREDYYAQKKH